MKLNITDVVALYKQYTKAKELYDEHPESESYRNTLNEIIDRFNESSEKLTASIKEAEGRASARCINAEDICRILMIVEQRVPTKKGLNGTSVDYDGGEKFPRSYISRYSPSSTHFTAVYKNSRWYITDIYRDTCPDRSFSGTINFSEVGKEAVIKSASRL